MVEYLWTSGTISDLVVVALLRINSIETKEILARAMFNLTCRAEVRLKLLSQGEFLSSFLELTKVESWELLELATRILYNISCELENYSTLLHSMKVSLWSILRLTGNITNVSEFVNFCV